MPGRFDFSGERAQRALSLLRTVTDILDDASIRYWLDSGTLLGVIREQRLLPWDNDLDLGISHDQVPKLLTCIPALRRCGLRIRQRYLLAGDGVLPAGETRLFKLRNRRWHFFKGDLLLDIFVCYRSDEQYHWQLLHKGSALRCSVPARHFDTLAQVDFEGRRYPVPGFTEDYLAHRYGDWKVPNREWSCFSDDLALELS